MQVVFSMGSVACVLLSAVFFTASFRLNATTDRVLSLYLFAFASLMAASTLGSLFSVLDESYWFLLIQGVLAGLGVTSWWRLGKPSLNLRNDVLKVLQMFVRAPQAWRVYPLTMILGGAVVIAYLIAAFLILYVPPNESDALVYRLPRAVYWLQHGDFSPWVTDDYRQTAFPFGAEIPFMWAMMLAGSDRFVVFAQWIAALVTTVAVYGITILAGLNRRQAIFAALMWATLPQVYLQSTSPQTDLIVGVLATISVYFLYKGLLNTERRSALLGGLAMGLALGTKFTIFFAGPGLVVAGGVIWLINPKRYFRPLLTFAISTLISGLLLSSYIYVQNAIVFDGVFGADSLVESVADMEQLDGVQKLSVNLIRMSYQMIEFMSMPRFLSSPLLDVKSAVYRFAFAHTPVLESKSPEPFVLSFDEYIRGELFLAYHEYFTWYGVLGFTVIPLGLVWAAVRGRREKNIVLLTLPILFVGFCLTQAYLQGWTPNKGRYFVFAFALASPSFAILLPPSGGRTVWCALAVFFAVLQLIPLATLNPHKPLVGEGSVLGMTYDERRFLRGIGGHTFDMVASARQVVPEDVGIGILDNQFPRAVGQLFFGDDLSRWTVKIPYDPFLTLNELTATHGRDFLLFRPRESQYADFVSLDHVIVNKNVPLYYSQLTGWESLLRQGDFVLLRRTDPTAPFTSRDAVPVRYVNEFDAPQLEWGWHGVESGGPAETLQWSSQPTSLLEMSLDIDRDYRLQFEVVAFLQAEMQDTFTVSLNGVALATQVEETEAATLIYEAIVPSEVMRRATLIQTIEFSLDEITSPEALGISPDPRPLGLAIDWVRLEPLSDADENGSNLEVSPLSGP